MSKNLWGVFRMFNGGNGIKMCENMKYIYNYLNNYIYYIYVFGSLLFRKYYDLSSNNCVNNDFF